MAQEFRFDSHRLDARQLRRDARGMALAKSRATRVGVFEYTRADGSKVRELRRPEVVFAPSHLETLVGASLTIGHPPEHVNPSNMRQLEVGVVTSARQDGSFVAADLSIRDASVIGKVERGELVELSCGYTCDVDPRPGVWQGERYDQAQINLRVNHIALLPPGHGRAGPEVRIRADAAGASLLAVASTFYDDNPTERGSPMYSYRNELRGRIAHQELVLREQRSEIQTRLDALERKYSGDPKPATLQERLDAIQQKYDRMGGRR